MLKRCVDLIGASVALIMLFPLMVMTAILIKLDSRGPVFLYPEAQRFQRPLVSHLEIPKMTVLEDNPGHQAGYSRRPQVHARGTLVAPRKYRRAPAAVKCAEREYVASGTAAARGA